MSENQITASQPEGAGKEQDAVQKEKRSGAKDRRTSKADRRNAERLAEDIAPRRHPNVKGRRNTDR